MIKNFNFFLLFVFGKIAQEKVFGDAVGRKLAFLVYKNIDLRKSHNLHFFKGASPWFFLLFVFGKISQEKVLGDVVNTKLASEDYRNTDLRKSENLHFSIVLVKNWTFFFISFWTKYGPKRCLRTL